MNPELLAQPRSRGKAHWQDPQGFQAEAAFKAGNWADAALHGKPGDGLAHWAGKARCGFPDQAAAALAELAGPEARYQEGVAHWLAGREGQALGLWRPLAQAGDERAGRLVAWLSTGQRLPVAWLGASVEGGAGDLCPGLEADPRFAVMRLGMDVFDPHVPLPWDRGASLSLFTAIHMVEWCGVPERIAQFPGKVFGFTSDFDLHLPQTYSWMQALDGLCVLDGTEWGELVDLVDRPCISIPQALGLATSTHPGWTWGERALDVFLSGTQVHAYHPDKAALAHAVLEAFGPAALGMNGWLNRPDYLSLMSQARVTYSHYRRPGGTVTRALEALGQGLGVAVQAESILRLYFGEAHGVRPYRHGDPEDLVRSLHALLGRPPEEAEAACAAARLAVEQHFNLAHVGQHVGRLLLVAAAETPGPRPTLPEASLAPQRLVLSRGWVPEARLRVQRFDRCTELLAQSPSLPNPAWIAWCDNAGLREMHLNLLDALGPNRWVAMGAEVALALQFRERLRSLVSPERLHAYQVILDELVAKHPTHLALQLNALWMELALSPALGASRLVAQGQRMWEVAPEAWVVDPLDELMPWDVWSLGFDHRGWVDHATALQQGRTQDLAPLVARALACVAFHLAEWDEAPEALLAQAQALVPDFAPYGLALAKAQLASGQPDAVAKAEASLASLAQGSSVWPLARQALAEHLAQARHGLPSLPHFASPYESVSHF